jgi:redox-sensitive bicupin YhaK (pirin superfamily)
MAELRRSGERGFADHGWLQSFHSFSFADYFDPRHVEFGPLRVINEDRVAPGKGFGMHSHRDMEILSYVLEGALAHKDSTGGASTIRPGDVQRMSAGRGVTHSEFNPSATESVHFLQIWIQPNVTGIPASYEEKHFSDEDKRAQLRLIASPDAVQGSVLIHQDARVYAGLFDGAQSARLPVRSGRRLYVHAVRGEVQANNITLQGGDAVKLTDVSELTLQQGRAAEVLVFDLPGEAK